MHNMAMSGRVALITGAGRMRGIGRAAALLLAAEGAAVVVSSAPRDPATYPPDEKAIGWQGAESVAREIEALGGRATAIECDVSRTEQVAAMFDHAERVFGTPDAIVNNAGSASGFGSNPIIDSDDRTWRTAIDVNINGTYYMCKLAGQAMRAAGRHGAIVNVSSLAGRMGYPDCGAYCASKFAIIGMTQQLALEYASLGIRVNCVCPGATQTDMMQGTIDRSAEAAGSTANAVLNAMEQSIPLGRIGEPADPAAAIAFLLSPNASYITGQSLNVCGGLRMD